MKGANVPNQDPRPPAPEGSYHAQERQQNPFGQSVPDPASPYGYSAQHTASYGGAAYGGQGGSVPPAQPYTYQQAPAPAPQKPKKGHPFIWGLLGGLLCSAAVVACLYFTGLLGGSATVRENDPTGGQNISIDVDGEMTVAEAVSAKCLPSVVGVLVTMQEGTGSGSGVILDTEGHILTNAHVIEDAEAISVTIDGESYAATVVGSDHSSDLAVIQANLEGTQVTPIEVGDSSALEVGEWVMTIGSPFGLDQSVSSGIVSSLYRSTILADYSGNKVYTNLIQTDAFINPGNSGGALVNEQGQLVGINSVFQSYSGSSSGVGFAIPSNYAIEVANTLISGDEVQHAFIGVNVQTVTAQFATANNLPVNYGAYVVSLTPGGPAAEAGLQEGDIITAIGDTKVTSGDGLILAVRSGSVGDKTTVTYWRGNEEHTADITLGSDVTTTSPTDQNTETTSPNQQYQDDTGNGYGQELPPELLELLQNMMQ